MALGSDDARGGGRGEETCFGMESPTDDVAMGVDNDATHLRLKEKMQVKHYAKTRKRKTRKVWHYGKRKRKTERLYSFTNRFLYEN